MRSSKNRSRSKGSRNRSVGNIVNRVFDSSGPEGKVRGTPQQIIDKYNQLTRDAQLGNDRVAAENFQQHAEHYLRLLAEAQREQEARREQQQQQQGGGKGDGGRGDGGRGDGGRGDGGQSGQGQGGEDQRRDRGGDRDRDAAQGGDGQGRRSDADRPFDAVIDAGDDGKGGLVETPESGGKPKRSRSRRPRKSDEGEAAAAKPEGDGPASTEAAE